MFVSKVFTFSVLVEIRIFHFSITNLIYLASFASPGSLIIEKEKGGGGPDGGMEKKSDSSFRII